MKDVLVTIVVPIYNVEAYIRECLDSILSQTYENIEILAIDDGSPDNSGKIADEYAKADNRIRVIHKKNEGQPKTKNHGIKEAKGELITFVDSDDYIRDDFVTNLVTAMTKHEVQIVTTTKTFPIDDDRIEEVKVYDQRKAFEEMFYGTLEESENGVQLYRRDLLIEHRVFSNSERKIGEDFDFLAQALLHCDKIAVDNRKMYFYRPNPGSLMHQSVNTEIMKSIKTFSSIGEAIVDIYPSTQRAIDAKRFNDSVALAIRAYGVRHEWASDFNDIWKHIKGLKWQILLDDRARRKVRLAALIYCVLGNNLGTILIRRIKK